ncbi:MAG: acyl--CoA ligase, partial [Sphingomonas sp.]|nr:acyl--CoA ligase [Sphingomonas sp.]
VEAPRPAVGGGRRAASEGQDMISQLQDYLTRSAERDPDHLALVMGDDRLSYGELEALTNRLARLLQEHGCVAGSRVCVVAAKTPWTIAGLLAVLKAGGMYVPIDSTSPAPRVARIFEAAEPSLVLADPTATGLLDDMIEEGGLPPGVPIGVVDDSAGGARFDPAFTRADAVKLSAEPLGRSGDASDTAHILFTSGSTGGAKGAVSTHRSVTTGVYAYATGLMVLLGIMESEGRPPANPPRTLVNVPLFHVTGEVPVLLNSFVIGRGMVLMAKWDPAEAFRLIEKEKITYFVGVPTMSLELMTHLDRDKHDLSSLTDIAAGGAPRPISHVERLQKTFESAQPALGYGLTETNAVGCSNFWSNYADKPGSTGRAQKPFVEIAILGDGDGHLPSGERGEIGIKSAANFKGYWRDPEATRAAFTDDGYVRTGDIGYLDEDGYLFIVDRKKDIIIRGGENISAAEVEAACYGHPQVAEVSVFGAPDERLGEVPIAVVHGRDGLDEAALREFLEGRVAAFKVPARFIFSDEPLPRLGTGKIDRVALKDRFAR